VIEKVLSDGNWELHGNLEEYIESGAIFNQKDWQSATHRYSLWRVWNSELPRLLFIMLNCSKGNHFKLTKTSEYCDNIAKRGINLKGELKKFGSVEVVNLFSFITSKSKILKSEFIKNEKNIIGQHNDKYIKIALERASLVIVAWGCDPDYQNRYISVLGMIKNTKHKPYSLYVNEKNYPYHPYGILRNRKRLFLPKEDQYDFVKRRFSEYF
jgi:hypothetical protein